MKTIVGKSGNQFGQNAIFKNILFAKYLDLSQAGEETNCK